MSDTLIGTLISLTILVLFGLIVLARIQYSIFLEEVRKVKPNWSENMNGLLGKDGGEWVPGFATYWFRPPFPITITPKSEKIQKAKKQHNLTIKIFWIVIVTWVPLLIITLNLIE